MLEIGSDFLLMEWLESGTPLTDHDERLGLGLAELHRARTEPDRPTTWELCRKTTGPAPAGANSRRAPPSPVGFTSLAGTFRATLRGPARFLPDEPLSRLHGDLWGGNALVGPLGEPCLIDPAVYVGHREIDLAMMRLFGGSSPRVWDSYQEAYPLTVGFANRVPLYQLYPLLVHFHLFGESYATQVEQALKRLPG